jgi:hypothetical protein
VKQKVILIGIIIYKKIRVECDPFCFPESLLFLQVHVIQRDHPDFYHPGSEHFFDPGSEHFLSSFSSDNASSASASGHTCDSDNTLYYVLSLFLCPYKA